MTLVFFKPILSQGIKKKQKKKTTTQKQTKQKDDHFPKYEKLSPFF